MRAIIVSTYESGRVLTVDVTVVPQRGKPGRQASLGIAGLLEHDSRRLCGRLRRRTVLVAGFS